jgi:hypothetical protein
MSYGWLGYFWLWPGLPQAWNGGRWPGAATALGFAAAVESLLLASWVWDELLGDAAFWGLALATGCGWLIGITANRRWLARHAATDERNAADDPFPAALTEYLQGNWFAAEQQCRDLIRLRRDDVDARLLLATLLRHTERKTEARAELDALAKLDGAAKWALEITHERRLLDETDGDDAESKAEEAIIPVETAIRRAA